MVFFGSRGAGSRQGLASQGHERVCWPELSSGVISTMTSQIPNSQSGPPLLEGILNGKRAYFFLDNGSSSSMVSSETLRQFKLHPIIEPSDLTIRGVTGNAMASIGSAMLDLSFGGINFTQRFIVVDGSYTPGHLLLGHDFIVDSGMWQNASLNVILIQGLEIRLVPYSSAWGNTRHFQSARIGGVRESHVPDNSTVKLALVGTALSSHSPNTPAPPCPSSLPPPSPPTLLSSPPQSPPILLPLPPPTPLSHLFDESDTQPSDDEAKRSQEYVPSMGMADPPPPPPSSPPLGVKFESLSRMAVQVPMGVSPANAKSPSLAVMSDNDNHGSIVDHEPRLPYRHNDPANSRSHSPCFSTDEACAGVASDGLPFFSDPDGELNAFSWHETTMPYFALAQTVKIDPNHSVLVNVKAKVRDGEGKPLVKLNGTSLVLPEYTLAKNVCVLPALYKIHNGCAQIHIVNLSQRVVTLHPGQRISNLEHTDEHIVELELPSQEPAFCGAATTSHDDVIDQTMTVSDRFPEGRDVLRKLFADIPDILPTADRPLGRTSLLQHSISLLAGAKPTFIPSYKIPHSRRQILEKEVQGMIDMDIIEPSNSPWSSPMLLVPKKDGTFRPVVDYRRLNAVTIPEPYPMPNLRGLLKDIRCKSKVFSTIDLAKGFLQVPLEINSRPLTAFSTNNGHFQFKVSPMGLRNSPLTFCRLMSAVLQGLLDDCTLVYLDDILVCTPTVEEHEIRLRKIFERLQSSGLTINPTKCRFFQEELNYLGHTINASGVLPNNAKIEAISDYAAPINAKQVRSFLGLAGFYRPFIYKYGQLAAPLSNLTRKDVPFRWGEEEQRAFAILKERLVTAPILIFPDFDKPFHLFTDASNEGLGAALMQNVEGKYKPVAYASRMMNKSERNYSTTDREMLAIVWALRHFEEIILGYDITVHTDHMPLTTCLTGKDPHHRRARYQLTLGEFDVKFVHIPGKDNGPPDALSRAAMPAKPGDLTQCGPDTFPPSFASSYAANELQRSQGAVTKKPPVSPILDVPASTHLVYHGFSQSLTIKTNEEWIAAQSADPVFGPVVTALREGKPVPKVKGVRTDELRLLEGLLYRLSKPKKIKGRRCIPRQALVVPEEFLPMVCQYGHEGNGHAGLHKTARFLREKFFFPKLYMRVAQHVGECATCPLHKGSTNAPAPVLTYDVPERPWLKVSCDTLQFIPSLQGNKYLVVFIDNFSRYTELVVVKQKSAEAVAKAFYESIICRHGTPCHLMHDNGTEFVNEILKQLCKAMNVNQVNVLPYRPQANGITERLNRSIIQILRTVVNEHGNDWDSYIPAVQSAINSTFHASLGDTPDFLLHGWDRRLPFDLVDMPLQPLYTGNYAEFTTRMMQVIWGEFRKALTVNRDARIEQQHRLARTNSIGVGALVWHKVGPPDSMHPKLAPRFEGPLRVIKFRNNKCTCWCFRTGKTFKYHVDTLKLASEYYQEMDLNNTRTRR